MDNMKLFTRNFKLLLFGQISSLLGNGILKIALSLYILETTGSATIFAGLLSVATIPTIILSPFGGILADRANRRNVMVGLDLLMGVTTFLGFILFQEDKALFLIGSLLIVHSVLGAFESPTVQASVPQMQLSEENIIKANAVINQAAALSGLIAPLLGSILYSRLGLQNILIVGTICFLITALFECFIKLTFVRQEREGSIINMVRSDFSVSFRFITKKQPKILKLLLLAALMNFLLVGTIVVGLPFIVRNVLGLSAQAYGAASSILGLSAVLGGVGAGILVTKLNPKKLYVVLSLIGLFLLPIGISFLVQEFETMKYVIIVASLFIVQFLVMIFSVVAMSIIQQRTPNEFLGKIMAYATTVSLCAQPIGQMIYGFVFDQFPSSLFMIFAITGLATLTIGLLSKNTFNGLDDLEVHESILENSLK